MSALGDLSNGPSRNIRNRRPRHIPPVIGLRWKAPCAYFTLTVGWPVRTLKTAAEAATFDQAGRRSRLPRTILKALLLLFPFLVLVIAACGGDSATDTPAAPEPTAAPNTSGSDTSRAVAPTPTPVPRSTPLPTRTSAARPTTIIDGGTLLRLGPEPPTLDPHLTTDASSSLYIVEIFGGLMTISKDLVVTGDLAEDWTMSQDGSNFTFRLNRDARFHDGRSVTARDVKWSLERAADPAIAAPPVDVFLGDIVGVS